MRRLLAVMAVVSCFGAGSAHSDSAPVVVELYTSQGCSSCPPADELLGELTGRDDVIPLSFHVDYWDYIGWKDVFGNRAFTKRQKEYARASGHRMVYTPQMIVGGYEHVVGYKPMKLADLIMEHRDRPTLVMMDVSRAGTVVSIRIPATPTLPNAMVLELVRYIPEATTQIRKGENAGQTITYYNIVTDLARIGEWDGSQDFAAEVNLPGEEAAALILQAAGNGPILSAAWVR